MGAGSWRLCTGHFGALRPVHAPELLCVERGRHGRALPRGYSVAMEAARTMESIGAALGPGRFHLVGWSYGAQIALEIALAHRERIARLTVIEPPAFWVLPGHGAADPEARAAAEFYLGLAGEIRDAQLERFLACAGITLDPARDQDPALRARLRRFRASLRASFAAVRCAGDPGRLAAFDRPVMVVIGQGTAGFLARIAETIAASVAGARVHRLPGGHLCHLADAGRFNALLERFIGHAEGGSHQADGGVEAFTGGPHPDGAAPTTNPDGR
ncbi:MAG TPA: alpha/beta hydrolase [Longimicrobium sp.]|nr:alpha/beta hydrolase [Longimicrobium sp.]